MVSILEGIQLRITGDGSHTLFSPGFKDTYHSSYGAVTESEHIFIGLGLKCVAPDINPLNILELGFGSGLNLLLTLRHRDKSQGVIQYHGVEAFPIPTDIVSRLNYPQSNETESFQQIHSSPWGEIINLETQTRFLKGKADIREFHEVFAPYNLVYFDAFAPEFQPELWTEIVFKKIFDLCASGAILVTFSSKGIVKRALRNAGFTVEKHAGPPGKREVIRAFKP